MQISLSIVGFSADTPSPVDAFVGNLAKLRDEGFRRIWLAQLPYDVDLPTVLGIALREVDTIELGSGVIPIQVQHPMQLAQRALTLSLISGGRFTLGIGMSHRMVAEGVWGASWDKPVRQMREYLDGLQPLLAGQPADVSGDFWTTRGSLQIPTGAAPAATSGTGAAPAATSGTGAAPAATSGTAAPAPDVYLAALGPQMLRLAGRRTAGTLTWMTGPKTLAGHIVPTLRQAAADAGRPESAVRVAASLPVSVTDDVAGARARAAEDFAIYGQLPSYRAMLDREGYAGPEDAAIIGDEQTVSERLDELAASGVDEFTAAVFDPSPDVRARTRALLLSKAS